MMQEHQQLLQDKEQAIIDAKNEYVPVGGALITCSMQMKDPKDPSKTRQVRLPYQALDWLIQLLEKQGASLDKIEQMDPGAIQQMQGMQQQQQMVQPGQPGPMPR